MDNDWLLVSLFVASGVLAAIVCHYFIKNYLVACGGASILAAVTIQVSDYVLLGYIDPFSVFAFPAAVLLYFLLAAVIGIPFAIIRKRRGERILIPDAESRR